MPARSLCTDTLGLFLTGCLELFPRPLAYCKLTAFFLWHVQPPPAYTQIYRHLCCKVLRHVTLPNHMLSLAIALWTLSLPVSIAGHEFVSVIHCLHASSSRGRGGAGRGAGEATLPSRTAITALGSKCLLHYMQEPLCYNLT